MKYYQVKVQFPETEDRKKETNQYLVEAISPTEAEARITKYLVNEGEQKFEVQSANQSKIVAVV